MKAGYENWHLAGFDKWLSWRNNAVRISDLMEASNKDSSHDLQAENERISLILKSMEVNRGTDYIRNTWEIRFADDELYGIFILKY